MATSTATSTAMAMMEAVEGDLGSFDFGSFGPGGFGMDSLAKARPSLARPSPTGRQAGTLCRGRAQRGSLALSLKRGSTGSEGLSQGQEQGQNSGEEEEGDEDGEEEQEGGKSSSRRSSGGGFASIGGRDGNAGQKEPPRSLGEFGGMQLKKPSLEQGPGPRVGSPTAILASEEQRDTTSTSTSSPGRVPEVAAERGRPPSGSDMRAKRSRAFKPAPLDLAPFESETLDDGGGGGRDGEGSYVLFDSEGPNTPTWEDKAEPSWSSTSPVHSEASLLGQYGLYGMHGYAELPASGRLSASRSRPGLRNPRRTRASGLRQQQEQQEQQQQQHQQQLVAESLISPLSGDPYAEGSYNLCGGYDGLPLGVPSYTYHQHAFEGLGPVSWAKASDLVVTQLDPSPGQKSAAPLAPPMIRPVSTTLNRRRKALQERVLARHLGPANRKSGGNGRTGHAQHVGVQRAAPSSALATASAAAQAQSSPRHSQRSSRSWDPLGSGSGPGGAAVGGAAATANTSSRASASGSSAARSSNSNNGSSANPAANALSHPHPKLPATFASGLAFVSAAAVGRAAAAQAANCKPGLEDAAMVVVGSAGSMLVLGRTASGSGTPSGSPVSNSSSGGGGGGEARPRRTSRGSSVTFAIPEVEVSSSASLAAAPAVAEPPTPTPTPPASTPTTVGTAIEAATTAAARAQKPASLDDINCSSKSRSSRDMLQPSPPSSPKLAARRPASARDRSVASAGSYSHRGGVVSTPTPTPNPNPGPAPLSPTWTGSGSHAIPTDTIATTSQGSGRATAATASARGRGGQAPSRPRSAGVTGRPAFPPWTTPPESRTYRFDR